MIKSRVFNNAKWIIACRVAQSLLQFLIGMLCARYLGPSNYGIINYAASIIGFVLPVMQLGLNATLVQELIDDPKQEGRVMGTSLVMELVSAVACMVMVGTFVGVVNHNEPQTIIVCILYSISLIFRALEIMQYWFQYKLMSKYPSIIMLVAYIAVSAYRIFLLVALKSIYWFAFVNVLDYAIIGIALLWFYNKKGNQRLGFSFSLVKKMFAKSKYYILASMMVTVFQNTDHIMLKNISGNEENGFYTAAVISATVLQFAYTAIIDSVRPTILEDKKNDVKGYHDKLIFLYSIITYVCLVQCIGFTVFSKLIINMLYGAEYSAAVPVLRIVVWYTTFAYMGMVRNIWILAEGKHKILWKINLIAAVLNVIINALLIPKYGAIGAGVASLITQIFANFILGFIVKPLRENNKLLIKGLNPKVLISVLKQIKQK